MCPAGVGRVLFVSHNMAAVKRLCSRAMLLRAGRIELIGTPAEVIDNYLGGFGSFDSHWTRDQAVPSAEGVYFREIWLTDSKGAAASAFGVSDAVGVNFLVEVPVGTRPCAISVRLTNRDGVAVFTTSNTDGRDELLALSKGCYCYRFEVPARFLAAGAYSLTLVAQVPRVFLFDVVDGVAFTVEDTEAALHDERLGVVNVPLEWSCERVERGAMATV